MLTRWEQWYTKENLRQDPRILAAPPSRCAREAAREFSRRGLKRILDLACGVGRDTFYLSEYGLMPFAVDASMNGLLAASQRQADRKLSIDFSAADARCLPFPAGAFDGVYCFGLLHEFTDDNRDQSVKQILDEIRRVLSGDGLLILSVLAGDPAAGLPAVQMFDEQMLEQAFSGWKVIKIEQYEDTGCTNRSDYRIWVGWFEK